LTFELLSSFEQQSEILINFRLWHLRPFRYCLYRLIQLLDLLGNLDLLHSYLVDLSFDFGIHFVYRCLSLELNVFHHLLSFLLDHLMLTYTLMFDLLALDSMFLHLSLKFHSFKLKLGDGLLDV